MSSLSWLTDWFTQRDRAHVLYKRGMVRAQKHDHQGAVVFYTAALDAPEITPELTAMVLYNRGLVYVASGMAEQGAADLNAVLTMNEAGANVKKAAQQKLAKIESRTRHRV
ncbi:hypothetical protein AB1L30_05020 [Bremerella sp. JC817]|uniref:hypothetical protein n=1 Tax=Bremerella sp. JC817 TaxID=3231756 RepID=UPI003459229E